MDEEWADSLEAYYRRDQDLRVTCRRCGHERSLSPFGIMGECRKRGRSEAMPDVVKRLRCSTCGARDVFVEPVLRPGKTSMRT